MEHDNSISFLDNLEKRIELQVLGEFRNVPDGMQWEGVESAKMLFNLWRQARIEAAVRNIELEADQNRPTNLDSVNIAVESLNPDPINGILLVDLGNGPTHPIAGTSSTPVNKHSCSGAVVSSVNRSYPPRKEGSLVSPFKKCLLYYKTPEKKARKYKDVFPAVCSNEKWRKYHENLAEKKRLKEEERLNKKQRSKKGSKPEGWICGKCQ